MRWLFKILANYIKSDFDIAFEVAIENIAARDAAFVDRTNAAITLTQQNNVRFNVWAPQAYQSGITEADAISDIMDSIKFRTGRPKRDGSGWREHTVEEAILGVIRDINAKGPRYKERQEVDEIVGRFARAEEMLRRVESALAVR
jgi:hypothetical protein